MMRLFLLAPVAATCVLACSAETTTTDDDGGGGGGGQAPTYASRFDLECRESAGSYGADASLGFDVAADVFTQCSAPLPEPCQTLTVRDGSFGGPSEPLDRLTFDCLADAFIAGEPALIRMTRGNGINFNTTVTVAIIGDGTAVVRSSSQQDLGGTSSSYRPRAKLRSADHFEGCKATADDEQAVSCLFDYADGCAESGDVCSSL